jgi:O-antigen ligase
MNLIKYKFSDFFYKDNFYLFIYLLIPTSIIFSKFLAEVLIFTLLIYVIFNIFKKKLINSNYFNYKNDFFNVFYSILFFFIIIFINKIINYSNFVDLIKPLGLLRFSIIFLLPFILIKINKIKFNKNIFFFIIAPTVILNLDLIFQFYYGYNIIGYPFDNDYKRASSFFGKEKIAGYYLYFNFFLILFSLKFFRQKMIIYILIGFTYFAIYLTGDRMPFLLVNFSILILSILFLKNIINFLRINFNKKFLYIFLFIAIISTIINSNVKKIIITEKYSNSVSQVKNFNFEETRYYYHFNKAILIFKNNFIFGTGYKTFRIECSNEKYNNDNFLRFNGCATHPHNYYLEIMSENGIVGLIAFVYIIYILIKYLTRKINNNDDGHNKIMLAFILSFFFPFKTTGSFYTNFNLIMFFFLLSFYFFLNSLKKN